MPVINPLFKDELLNTDINLVLGAGSSKWVSTTQFAVDGIVVASDATLTSFEEASFTKFYKKFESNVYSGYESFQLQKFEKKLRYFDLSTGFKNADEYYNYKNGDPVSHGQTASTNTNFFKRLVDFCIKNKKVLISALGLVLGATYTLQLFGISINSNNKEIKTEYHIQNNYYQNDNCQYKQNNNSINTIE